jgi:alkylhydroperoxidase/carboxymuconolactone decarboxylase family protein YurZ
VVFADQDLSINKGFRADSSNMVHRGLDLSDLTRMSEREIEAFRDHYAKQFGTAHGGLDWWLDKNTEVLKRYRLFGSLSLRVEPRTMGHGYIGFYAMLGFETGVRYCVYSGQQAGLTKAQSLETIAMAFMYCGPRGMETIAQALADYEFVEQPAEEARFPDGWAVDRHAFESGLDFSSPELTPAELASLRDWYQVNLGEIPGYVELLGRYKPDLLKAYRNRFENTLYTLPKQMWPTTQLFYNCLIRQGEGIRENVLLARAFGVAKDDVLAIIGNSLVYGEMETAELVHRHAGDVLEAWQA